MNETIKHILERNSCRDFKDTPVKKEHIETLVKTALAAPSARNIQPWHIIVVTDKALIEEIDAEGMKILRESEEKAMYEMLLSRGGKLFYNAPCLILVLSDGSEWATLDSGILCQNVVIAAESLGLGTCIVGLARIPLSGPKKEEYKKRLKFPENHEFCIGILTGEINKGKAPHDHDPSKVSYIP